MSPHKFLIDKGIISSSQKISVHVITKWLEEFSQLNNPNKPQNETKTSEDKQ